MKNKKIKNFTIKYSDGIFPNETVDIVISKDNVMGLDEAFIANKEEAVQEVLIKTAETKQEMVDLLTLAGYADEITIEDTYTTRETAKGEGIGSGTKSVLKKVVGSTVACKQLFDIESLVFSSSSATNSNGKLIFDNSSNSSALYVPTENIFALKLKPNTTYSSRCRYKATFIRNDGSSGGSMSRSLTLQTVETFEQGDYKIRIFGDNISLTEEYKEGIIYGKFTTPADMSEFKHLVTRPNGYCVTEFSELMLVEGDYTESNFPEYQPYFTGLKSASFGGIESTNEDSMETSTLDLPKTEMPLGKTIDFEAKKITDYGVDLVLTGTEDWILNVQANTSGWGNVYQLSLPKTCDQSKVPIISENYDFLSQYWLIGDKTNVFSITSAVVLIKTDGVQTIDEFTDWLKQRDTDGNPVTIRYVSSVLQSETDFSADSSYTVWPHGTETIENENAQYGADLTLTQKYITYTPRSYEGIREEVKDGYVAKITGTPDSGATRGFVYGLQSDGTTPNLYKVQIQATADTIPLRNPNGSFYVGTPTLQYEAVNKGYVDENKGTKLYLHSIKFSNGKTITMINTNKDAYNESSDLSVAFANSIRAMYGVTSPILQFFRDGSLPAGGDNLIIFYFLSGSVQSTNVTTPGLIDTVTAL